MFSFLLARDTMHQNQSLAAIEDLKADGLEDISVPSNFSQEREMSEVAYRVHELLRGRGERPGPLGQRPFYGRQGTVRVRCRAASDGAANGGVGSPVEPRLYSTPKQPMQPSSS
jgi:Mn-containing catalase